MWEELETHWKIAFEQAWEAYKVRTVPIGAVVLNQDMKVVSTGRNTIFDNAANHMLAGTQMGHAELAALIQLKDRDHPQMNSYTLISTMEPCPMCFGTMVVSGIRNLEYAAKDSWAGASEIANTLEYVRNKNLKITRMGGTLEAFQICLQSAFEISARNSKYNRLLDSWRVENAQSVNLACDLYDEQYFDLASRKGVPVAVLYDDLIERLKQKDNEGNCK